jgi:hypothetical protein
MMLLHMLLSRRFAITISSSPNNLLYTFDEWELNGKTSRLDLSLLTRLLVRKELVTDHPAFDMNQSKAVQTFGI